ncbi:MAG: proteasome assembly chaperone family protein, partial [Nitrososphaeraceae archaeon]
MVRNRNSVDSHNSNHQEKYDRPIINSKVDTARVGSLRGDWRTTEINSTISGKERPIKLNSPLLIAGFPGPGLVGSISTSFIIETLELRQIACVESEFIVPGVIYVGGKLRHPFRLYANNEGTICVIVCETPILVQGIHRVLDAVMKWALESSVTSVLVLEGIPMHGIPDSKRHPFILSNSEENHTLINNLDEFDMNVKQTEKESQGD